MAIRDRSDMPANVINVDRGPKHPLPITKQRYIITDEHGQNIGYSHPTGNPYYARSKVLALRNQGRNVFMRKWNEDSGEYDLYSEDEITRHMEKTRKSKPEITIDQTAVNLVSQLSNVSKGVAPLLGKAKLTKQELTDYVELIDAVHTYMQTMLDSLQ